VTFRVLAIEWQPLVTSKGCSCSINREYKVVKVVEGCNPSETGGGCQSLSTDREQKHTTVITLSMITWTVRL